LWGDACYYCNAGTCEIEESKARVATRVEERVGQTDAVYKFKYKGRCTAEDLSADCYTDMFHKAECWCPKTESSSVHEGGMDGDSCTSDHDCSCLWGDACYYCNAGTCEIEDAEVGVGSKAIIIGLRDWKCYKWDREDRYVMSKGWSEKRTCERKPYQKFTGGNNAEYKGCGSCHCCRYLKKYTV